MFLTASACHGRVIQCDAPDTVCKIGSNCMEHKAWSIGSLVSRLASIATCTERGIKGVGFSIQI